MFYKLLLKALSAPGNAQNSLLNERKSAQSTVTITMLVFYKLTFCRAVEQMLLCCCWAVVQMMLVFGRHSPVFKTLDCDDEHSQPKGAEQESQSREECN